MLGRFGQFASFDIAIVREMYRTGQVTIAGVDPRLNVSRIASRLKCSRAKVAARLEEWERIGFLTRYDVWPNPALFELKGASVDVRVSDRLGKTELIEKLALLDGALGAIEFLGPYVTYQFLFPDEATRDRRLKLLRHVGGVAEVLEPLSWATIAPERRPSPLDLRIVTAMRAAPTASIRAIARTVGISSRTVTTRYGALVADWSVWFLPVFDFTRLPGPVVALTVGLDRPDRAPEVGRRLLAEYPDSLQFGWGGFGPIEPVGMAAFFVYLASAAAIEDLERTVARYDGVTGLEATVLVRIHTFPATLDALLASVRAGARTRLGRD